LHIEVSPTAIPPVFLVKWQLDIVAVLFRPIQAQFLFSTKSQSVKVHIEFSFTPNPSYSCFVKEQFDTTPVLYGPKTKPVPFSWKVQLVIVQETKSLISNPIQFSVNVLLVIVKVVVSPDQIPSLSFFKKEEPSITNELLCPNRKPTPLFSKNSQLVIVPLQLSATQKSPSFFWNLQLDAVIVELLCILKGVFLLSRNSQKLRVQVVLCPAQIPSC